jgi:chlorobactene glucosyltransferase
MNPVGFLVILSSVSFVLGLGVIIWIHSRTQMEINVEPRDWPQDVPAPLISMIVPARDEERNIRRCAQGLLEQEYPNWELIVVDDRSTDATAEILETVRLEFDRNRGGRRDMQVVQGNELPGGCAGKPFALVQGAGRAEGDWLCFIDADTFASPRLISSTILAAMDHEADMFSILTDQILGSFWERVVIPVVFTGLSFGFPAKEVNDPQEPNAIANGQFILIKTKVYRAVGGHQAVRERIDEDRALARLVKDSGYRLVLADGRDLARTRMYTSFRELWEGWTKNIFLGMQGRLGLLLFGGVLGLIAALVLPAWPLAGVLWWVQGGGPAATIITLQALVLWIVLVYIRARAARAFHISPVYGLTISLGALVFTSMILVSAFKVISGVGVTWKGRRYSG